MEQNVQAAAQTALIEQQKKITVTGVESVDAFSDRQIALTLSGGGGASIGGAAAPLQRSARCTASALRAAKRNFRGGCSDDGVGRRGGVRLCGDPRRPAVHRFERSLRAVAVQGGPHNGRHPLFPALCGGIRGRMRRFPPACRARLYDPLRSGGAAALSHKFAQNTCLFREKAV